MANDTDNQKTTLAQLLVQYLTNTKPWILVVHLLWLASVCVILSVTYIGAFHTTDLINFYQEAHNIKNFNTNLILSAKQDRAINDILDELVVRTHANRAYIFRYHNGLAAVSGVPFFFQTNTHEVIAPGTARVIQFEQHIPASINLAISNQFLANKCATVAQADGDKDSQNYYFYQVRAAKSLIRCPIFMNNGDLFGFVGIDYLLKQDETALENALSQVRVQSNALAGVFATKQ
jgi:hypothetical protein